MGSTTIDDLYQVQSIDQLQSYVARVGRERGFDSESIQDTFMLLVEELGEVAKALRPLHNVKVAHDSVYGELEHELADVQLLLLSLSNKLDIRMHTAVLNKEKKNRERTWR